MTAVGPYPHTRLRRLRQHQWSRELVAEHALSVNDLVWPLFVCEDSHPTDIPSMPGVVRHTLKDLEGAIRHATSLGIKAVALFPVTDSHLKCERGLEATNPQNLLCQAIRVVKSQAPSMGVITDVALDAYTTHGHDGVMIGDDVVNDATIEILSECALIQAQAGSDVVAPSDMMDGRIGAIRKHLDQYDFNQTMILSYAAKYASAFYGPFREALGSAPALGSKGKRTYQMDPANVREALREGAQDIEEGADILMIKPGLPYLDVVSLLKSTFHVPTFVYHISGEYAMLKAASMNGWINYDSALNEVMIAFKRAGADAIFTYAACDVAEQLNQ